MELKLDKLTDDKTIIGNILIGLKKKNGYCPCRVGKEEDSKCPCKEYRDTGFCHCGLYKNA